MPLAIGSGTAKCLRLAKGVPSPEADQRSPNRGVAAVPWSNGATAHRPQCGVATAVWYDVAMVRRTQCDVATAAWYDVAMVRRTQCDVATAAWYDVAMVRRTQCGRGEAFASHDPGKNTSCVRECFAPTASHRGPRCGRGRHRIVDRGVVVDDIASWTAVWSWTTLHRGTRCGRGRHCIVERGVVVDGHTVVHYHGRT
jgi:hypothetical protein